ncbi:MAG: hypothetical protein KDG44_17980, partial [Burkholderiaceae bacterium]|nr:hypothetical protein [Burkholderiaceae bacterium]
MAIGWRRTARVAKPEGAVREGARSRTSRHNGWINRTRGNAMNAPVFNLDEVMMPAEFKRCFDA